MGDPRVLSPGGLGLVSKPSTGQRCRDAVPSAGAPSSQDAASKPGRRPACPLLGARPWACPPSSLSLPCNDEARALPRALLG